MGFRTDMFGAYVFGVGGKPGVKLRLVRMGTVEMNWSEFSPLIEPKVCPPLHGDKISKPLEQD